MTATDFYIHYPEHVLPPVTIPTVDRRQRKAALAQIILEHPDCTQIFMRCWYEGTLPQVAEPVEPVQPFHIRRR